MTDVVKLGGSLITEKTARESIASDTLEEVGQIVQSARPASLIIVHGGGSFGHPVAADYSVSRTAPTRDPAAISAIADAMDRLNRAVVEAFVSAGVAAVSVHSGAMAWFEADTTVRIQAGAVRTLLAEGFVPVTRGDIVGWRDHGCAILSGDDLAVALARAIDADRLGLCADVPGVLDANGNVVEHIGSYEEVADLIDAPEATDVTGGMGRKIRTILDEDLPGAIFGVGDLDAFLKGDMPGTSVGGDAVSF